MTAALRRDRTGEPIEPDDRTPAEVAAYGAALVRGALAARTGRTEAKSTRYLLAGAVVVLVAGPEHIDAEVEGDSGRWTVRYRRGGWSCDCPGYSRCSHLVAVSRVAPRGGQR